MIPSQADRPMDGWSYQRNIHSVSGDTSAWWAALISVGNFKSIYPQGKATNHCIHSMATRNTLIGHWMSHLIPRKLWRTSGSKDGENDCCCGYQQRWEESIVFSNKSHGLAVCAWCSYWNDGGIKVLTVNDESDQTACKLRIASL